MDAILTHLEAIDKFVPRLSLAHIELETLIRRLLDGEIEITRNRLYRIEYLSLRSDHFFEIFDLVQKCQRLL